MPFILIIVFIKKELNHITSIKNYKIWQHEFVHRTAVHIYYTIYTHFITSTYINIYTFLEMYNRVI